MYQPLAKRRLRALPGVDALALTSVTPLTGHFDVNFMLFPDKKPGQASDPAPVDAKLRAAGPELQKVLGFRMLEGRFFNAGGYRDVAACGGGQSCLCDGSTPPRASRCRTSPSGRGNRAFHVVGVIDDFHQQGIAEPAAP